MTDTVDVVDLRDRRDLPTQRRQARAAAPAPAEPALDKCAPRALVVVWPLAEIRHGLELTPERRRQVQRLAAIVRDLLGVIQDRDVNLSALARRVGVNRSTVARILNGEQWPSFTVLEGLTHDLGVSLAPETHPAHPAYPGYPAHPTHPGLAERPRD